MADRADSSTEQGPTPEYRTQLIQRLESDQGERGYDLLTIDQLEYLLSFISREHPVLSVYLDVTPDQRPNRKYQLDLKEMVKGRENRVGSSRQGDFDAEVARVHDFLQYRYNEKGRGLAIFSCAERGLWEVYRLPRPLDNLLVFDERPYLRPLMAMMDEYERYGVILVDRQQARLFLVSLGEMEEYTDLESDVMRQHKQGGWSQARYERHVDDQAMHHLKRVAETAVRFFEGQQVSQLVIGGTEENVAWFRQYLPETLQARIAGTFPMRIDSPTDEVLAKVMDIQEHVERQKEAELVESLVTAASKGGQGVLGLDPTLLALQQQKIMTLVVADNFRADGSHCTHCDDLTANPSDSKRPCRLCGQQTVETVDHLTDLMMKRVVELGGDVDIVKNGAGRIGPDGIGALLRY